MEDAEQPSVRESGVPVRSERDQEAEQPSVRESGVPVRSERDQEAEQPSVRESGVPVRSERDQEAEQPSVRESSATDEATELGRTIVAQARAIRRRMIQDAEDRRRATRDALEAARRALDQALAALDVEADEREPEPNPQSEPAAEPAAEVDAVEPERSEVAPSLPDAGPGPDRPAEPEPEGQPSAPRSPESVFALLRGTTPSTESVAPAGDPTPSVTSPRGRPGKSRTPKSGGSTSKKSVPSVAEPPVAEPAVPESAVPEAEESDPIVTAPEVSADDVVRARRDEVLAGVLPELRRATQRVLGDEHNVLLDAIRRAGSRVDAARVLPDPASHREAWGVVLAPALDVAYAGGREVMGGRTGRGAPARLVKELSEGVVAPLRDRLTAAIDAAVREGPHGTTSELHRVMGAAISARYREWRGGDLERLLGDLLAAAYAQGSYDAAPSGARLQWIPAEPGQCPDCDDNALEPTVKGHAFPTGRPRPPAHPGCRCLIVLADTEASS